MGHENSLGGQETKMVRNENHFQKQINFIF